MPTPTLLDEFGNPIPPIEKAQLVPYDSGGGWSPLIKEPFTGAWQRNISIDRSSVLTFHAVFACMTLIASDIAKLRVKLVGQDPTGIWTETKNPAFSPVIRKPNHFQTRIQFWEAWILSKLLRGNTYVLKERDERNVVVKLYVLNPARVRPMVSEADGAVFYELSEDYLSKVGGQIVVPAREIIHDRMNCLFHPLVGMSPIAANGLAATQGKSIQMNSTWFFDNRSMPGGILSAPGVINETTAARLKVQWEENFGGKNVGKIAILGDGLKFEKLPVISALDAQLIDQLKWTSEVVCSTFHVPPYKIGVGAMPSYNNVQALNIEYYTQCLQSLIEAAELSLDEGLGLAAELGTEFDLDGLLRMDSVSLVQSVRDAVSAGIMAPNEGRAKLDLKPVAGGESPYLQQQNYSLAALAKRDAKADPFGVPAAPAPAAGASPGDGEDDMAEEGDDKPAAANENARSLREFKASLMGVLSNAGL